MASPWIRFAWDLKRLPAKPASVASPYAIRVAKKDDLAVVQRTVSSALAMEMVWNDCFAALSERLHKQAEEVFAASALPAVVLQHGTRIIACSLLSAEESSDNHLLSGPCVLHEYQSRGLGGLVLAASLDALREAGFSRAYAVTRERAVSGRFLYPKFGGRSEPWTSDLDPRARAAE